jgi:hypothetical protein
VLALLINVKRLKVARLQKEPSVRFAAKRKIPEKPAKMGAKRVRNKSIF